MESIEVDEETRKELFEYAVENFQEVFYEEMMKNIKKLDDPDRYLNWYLGRTEIKYPCLILVKEI